MGDLSNDPARAKEMCNTEDEPVWFRDIRSLWCSWSPVPKGSMKSGTRFNAITRLLVYTTVVLIVCKTKGWELFAIGGMVMLLGLYFRDFRVKSSGDAQHPTKEEFAILSPEQLKMSTTTAVYNNSGNGIRMIDPRWEIPMSEAANLLRRNDETNATRLLPLNTANTSNSYDNYTQRSAALFNPNDPKMPDTWHWATGTRKRVSRTSRLT